MKIVEFYQALQLASNVHEVDQALDAFESIHGHRLKWAPVGNKENNNGIIAVAADTGRSIVERLTNGIDAILEREYILHSGLPVCRNPKEAAVAWLNIPEGGLSDMTPQQRRGLAQQVTVKVLSAESKSSRTIEVRDHGIGLMPEQMPSTILSLNESNKVQKHYLAGAYGQGGSSTFAASKYTFIASRYGDHPLVGFTLVRYEELPPEEYKVGRYVYLTIDNQILTADISEEEFAAGSLVRHFGYDLSNYSSPVGPNSIYGLLNEVLFDPVIPVWLDDYEVHKVRRVIKGSRNALNGAIDDGDDRHRGPALSYHMPQYSTTLGDYGRLAIEYWVLAQPENPRDRPNAAYVNPSKPIILTQNGQNQEEMSHTLIRKAAELPYLAGRLICHIDCNNLSPYAKRLLFVSNREGARRGVVYDLIQQEIVKALKSDDELTRLNNEAREHGRKQLDESAVQRVRKEVARLLRLQGIEVTEDIGGAMVGQGADPDRPARPRPPRPHPQPLDIHEPPTYVRIIWDENGAVQFYPGQRRYIRIETDANSTYHNPYDPIKSRFNIIATNGVSATGSTHLKGGRMRAIFECNSDAIIGDTGQIRIELSLPGRPILFDERRFQVVETPPARQATKRLTVPNFKPVPVDGPDDPQWAILNWPDDYKIVASSALMEEGTLMIYYSTLYPKYVEQRIIFEKRDPVLADSFTKYYEVWLSVHSLLLYQNQQDDEAREGTRRLTDEEEEASAVRERQERCRIATIAAMVAAREAQSLPEAVELEPA